MFVPFNNMPNSSRVWVYQSNRLISGPEKSKIEKYIEQFTETWQKHGEDLKASFSIKYNQFIILAVDQKYKEVSGCSIDASVHFIKQLESEFNLDLMNKMNVSFKIGENINTVPMHQFQQFVNEGKIDEQTTVFNNMVQTKEEFSVSWEVPVYKSWHKRFFNKVNS